ncbi:MAG: Error-prone repair protein ImuA [Bacteroidota bacterium]
MNGTKADIIARLQREILPLQGLKPALKNAALNAALGPVRHAFHGASFPLGAIHEFVANGMEDAAATGGFVNGLMSQLLKNKGVAVWISGIRTIFPPALQLFGIQPDTIIFIDLKKETEILWAMEEALKCKGLAAVIGEMKELSFTASRRLQLAVEQSQVTGFVLRRNPKRLEANACVSRWKIISLPSLQEDGMPGVGFPRWKVELSKTRNGKPGSWEIEWVAGHFKHVSKKTDQVWQPLQKVAG